jgi:hypothetical protein
LQSDELFAMLPLSAIKKVEVEIFNRTKEAQSFPEMCSLLTTLHCSIQQTKTIVNYLHSKKPQYDTENTIKKNQSNFRITAQCFQYFLVTHLACKVSTFPGR